MKKIYSFTILITLIVLYFYIFKHVDNQTELFVNTSILQGPKDWLYNHIKAIILLLIFGTCGLLFFLSRQDTITDVVEDQMAMADMTEYFPIDLSLVITLPIDPTVNVLLLKLIQKMYTVFTEIVTTTPQFEELNIVQTLDLFRSECLMSNHGELNYQIRLTNDDLLRFNKTLYGEAKPILEFLKDHRNGNLQSHFVFYNIDILLRVYSSGNFANHARFLQKLAELNVLES